MFHSSFFIGFYKMIFRVAFLIGGRWREAPDDETRMQNVCEHTLIKSG